MDNDLEGTVVYIISSSDKVAGELANRLRARALTIRTFPNAESSLAEAPPHILVADLEAGGANALRTLRERFSMARILVLGGGDEAAILDAFAGGAHGFVSHWEPVWTMESAVVLLARGGSSLSLPVLQTLLRTRSDALDSERSLALAADRGLSPRQVEVLQLVARGYTDAEIAETFIISVRTVNRHVSDILMKLGCDRRREAAALIFGEVPPGVRQMA